MISSSVNLPFVMVKRTGAPSTDPLVLADIEGYNLVVRDDVIGLEVEAGDVQVSFALTRGFTAELAKDLVVSLEELERGYRPSGGAGGREL